MTTFLGYNAGENYQDAWDAVFVDYLMYKPSTLLGPADLDFNTRRIDDFLNHACDGNCGFDDRGDIVATRAIAIGEELTYDYSDRNRSELRMRRRVVPGPHLRQRLEERRVLRTRTRARAPATAPSLTSRSARPRMPTSTASRDTGPRRRAATPCKLSLNVPNGPCVQYAQFIVNSATKHSLYPLTMAAIIAHESGSYDSDTGNPAELQAGGGGGRGLGQVDIDRGLAWILGAPDKLTLGAEWNIEATAAILSNDVAACEDTRDHQIVGYNGGLD